MYLAHNRKASNALCTLKREKKILGHASKAVKKTYATHTARSLVTCSNFHTVGPATEKARRPNMERRCRATSIRQQPADRRRCRRAMSEVWMQQSATYCGVVLQFSEFTKLRQVELFVGQPSDLTWKRRQPGRPCAKWTDQLRRGVNINLCGDKLSVEVIRQRRYGP